jgi:hypothetical protein
MANVLTLGADGRLARNTARVFLRDRDAGLKLSLRRAERLKGPDPERVAITKVTCPIIGHPLAGFPL